MPALPRVRGEIIEARAKRRKEIGETRRNRSRLSLAKGKAAKCSPGQGAFTNMFSHYFMSKVVMFPFTQIKCY